MNIDIETPYHVIVPDTLKITFNLQIESTDKTRRVINNVGGALFKKEGAHTWFNRY